MLYCCLSIHHKKHENTVSGEGKREGGVGQLDLCKLAGMIKFKDVNKHRSMLKSKLNLKLVNHISKLSIVLIGDTSLQSASVGAALENSRHLEKKKLLFSMYAKKNWQERGETGHSSLADMLLNAIDPKSTPMATILRCFYGKVRELAMQLHWGITYACDCIVKIASLQLLAEKNRPRAHHHQP
jgi:hypothetical protein